MSRITYQYFLGRKVVRFSGKPQLCTKIIKLPYETVALLATGNVAYSDDRFFKWSMTPQREYSYARLAEAMHALGVLSKNQYDHFQARATKASDAQERAREFAELSRLAKKHNAKLTFPKKKHRCRSAPRFHFGKGRK